MKSNFDRSKESLGNILHMEHVNLAVPDQRLATLFYIVGLQFTRDPFIMTGADNMWVNMGRCQIHLPSRNPISQRLRGTVGFVVPNLSMVEASLAYVAPYMGNTAFSYTRKKNHLEATCPWGNSFKLHEPAPQFGTIDIGMPYVELNIPPGTAEKVGRFYDEIFGAPVELRAIGSTNCTSIKTGKSQFLHFLETDSKQPKYDGHHIAVYISDFVGPYEKLKDRGLISMETDECEWRFTDIIDLDTGKTLFQIEHEVRSATHPLYSRPLINRNPSQSNRGYRPGQDNFLGQI
tara:strand:+ start:170 stop:1042 length:873 start_codon:yes stop_codon:yes gene_type:complete